MEFTNLDIIWAIGLILTIVAAIQLRSKYDRQGYTPDSGWRVFWELPFYGKIALVVSAGIILFQVYEQGPITTEDGFTAVIYTNYGECDAFPLFSEPENGARLLTWVDVHESWHRGNEDNDFTQIKRIDDNLVGWARNEDLPSEDLLEIIEMPQGTGDAWKLFRNQYTVANVGISVLVGFGTSLILRLLFGVIIGERISQSIEIGSIYLSTLAAYSAYTRIVQPIAGSREAVGGSGALLALAILPFVLGFGLNQLLINRDLWGAIGSIPLSVGLGFLLFFVMGEGASWNWSHLVETNLEFDDQTITCQDKRDTLAAFRARTSNTDSSDQSGNNSTRVGPTRTPTQGIERRPTVPPATPRPSRSSTYTYRPRNQQEAFDYPTVWSGLTLNDIKNPGTVYYTRNNITARIHRFELFWCADTSSRRQTFLDSMTVDYQIGDEKVALEDVLEYNYTSTSGAYCHTWVTMLDGLRSNTTIDVEVSYRISHAFFDGYSTYEAGTYRHIITLNLR